MSRGLLSWLLAAAVCLIAAAGMTGSAAAARESVPVQLMVAEERSLHHLIFKWRRN